MAYPRYSFQHSVLLIDRPENFENFIRSGLLFYPVQFEFCSNRLDEAIDHLNRSKPDLVVSSMHFESGSVLDFAAELKKRRAQSPAIYLTEPHLADLQAKLLKSGGAFDVVPRSNEPSDLIRKMDHAVRVFREFRRTRIEAFIDLHDQSIEKGVPVKDLLSQEESKDSK